MFKPLFAASLIALLPFSAQAESFAEMWPDLAADPELSDLVEPLRSLTYETGSVIVAGETARFDLGEEFYFLGPNSARIVLEDLWGNPPGLAVEGMIFPREATPLHETWGAVVEYDPMGYVEDDDAAKIDYDELLAGMQADTRDNNAYLSENGYDTVDLIGWAEPPHYDAETHKLYWAKELAYSGNPEHTLNYQIRALGRRGVLVMTVVGSMSDLEEVRAVTPALLDMTTFSDGNRYVDFDPKVDTVAAVGIGGLIAGKVAAKAGLLAIALAFLKKGAFLLLIPLFWLKNVIFGRRKGSDEA